MTKHLLHVFSTFAIGGPQVRLAQIINASPGDYRHTIIALDGNCEAKSKLANGVNIEFVDVGDMKALGLAQRFNAIKDRLQTINPDTLMTYNWGAIEWALVNRLAGTSKGVHWEDGFGPEEKEATLPRRNIFRRFALSGSTQVVVPSYNLMAIAKRDWRLPESRLSYFPNGIHIPAELPGRVPVSKGKAPTLVTLATLRAEKNIHRLIDSFIATAPEGKLLIGGSGPLLDELKRYAEQNKAGDRVEFSGYISDVWQFLAQGDVFCLTSDTEQMPISVLEAMGAGMPVVATDVGDINTMVAAENLGYIVPPEAFNGALADMLANPGQWQKIGAANQRKAAEKFSFAAMLDNFTRLT
ncbi:glycosyl transferase [Photobacterium sanctipauli]|uniref:Glycosyl transferase n=1 Tax=Photobacterium sanctipauli TaxID=1342794 RepID=A0A2T3NSR6_9GAMM|nr:glycosyltransferase family 4 protein [Photobacterium sanctipauli]PSW19298.1 glycosyl transferase [Photobacterium sanctipauli]